MKKILIPIIILLFFAIATPVSATEKASGTSAVLASAITNKPLDNREKILRDYLVAHNSPLADHAPTFIAMANKYNLDWKLLVAISGLESGFGQQIPSNSYNAWGWGIYGDNVKRFSSWDEAIETISQGLRERYINQLGTDDVYAIGQLYAASPTWAVRVERFESNIDQFASQNPTYSLSISL